MQQYLYDTLGFLQVLQITILLMFKSFKLLKTPALLLLTLVNDLRFFGAVIFLCVFCYILIFFKMNYIIVFALSMLDAIIMLPLNAELTLLYYLQKHKKHEFITFLKTSIKLYIIPSLIGTIMAYTIGYFFSDVMLYYINIILSSLFANVIIPNETILLKTLLTKIFLPLVPVSLINILCGIYSANFFLYFLISLILRSTRIIFLYNAILYATLFKCVTLVFYIGLFNICFKLFIFLFYKILFIQ